MKLLFMGTAAAEAIPALFCRCEVCRRARETGGREIRTRSGAMIDGTLKLDFGPDSYMHMVQNNIAYSEIHSILITHTHDDHLDLDDISRQLPPEAYLPDDEPPITFYGNEELGKKVAHLLGKRVHFRRMIPFEPVEIEGYTVTALEAVHYLDRSDTSASLWPVTFTDGVTYGRREQALFYLIEKDGHAILYAHDTDEFTAEDMEFLATKKLDLVSLDCTKGIDREADYIGHMGAETNLRMRERLIACGAADEHTVFVANHFSHNGYAPIPELEKAMPGFVVSYDGLVLETRK